MTLDTTATIDGLERQILVRYLWTKASKGARDSLAGVPGAGPPLEPDEPASIEVLSVRDAETGEDVDLGNDDEARIQQECWNDFEERNP